MAIIQLKRANTTTAIAMPPPGPNGELSFARGGFSNLPPHAGISNDLIISDGTAQQVLVGPSRQLELIGIQSVTGRKTFTLAALSILGGAGGQVLTTDGAGTLSWQPPSSGGIGAVATDGVTIQGDGSAGDPVSLITAIFTSTANSGLEYAPGAVTVAVATQTIFGGSSISTDPLIAAGTVDTAIISPRGLRTQLGANVTTLTTTAKTVVPAINEIHADLLALSGVMTLVGAYNAATNVVIPGSGGEIPAGALPPAAAANNGYYLIVTVAGTGTGNAPNVPMQPGSWIVSNGTVWSYIDVSQPSMEAGNVGVAPPVLGESDVQGALEALAARAVVVDAVSITGTGLTGGPLTVNIVDGGVF